MMNKTMNPVNTNDLFHLTLDGSLYTVQGITSYNLNLSEQLLSKYISERLAVNTGKMTFQDERKNGHEYFICISR